MLTMWRSSVGVMALLVVMGACGNRTGDSGAEDSGAAGADASRPLSEVHMNYDDQYGLDLWARFTPLRDGRVVNATMVAAGRSVPAYVMSRSFDTDNFPPPTHPRLRAGHAMRVNASVVPRCDDESHEAPVVTVTWREANGEVARSRLAVVMPGETPAETQEWVESVAQEFCSQSQQVRVTLMHMSARADGQSVTIKYVLRNPGPGEVTVTSQAWRSSGMAQWLPAVVVVPADGQPHELTVRGVDGICTSEADTPYALGLFTAETADGERHVLTGDDGDLTNVCPFAVAEPGSSTRPR
jgi:hypothetical protein